MSILRHKTLSRRSAIAGIVASWVTIQSGHTEATQVERPAPADLGHGLEIRDYRLFPTEDVMRFIVEIHNTTDIAVDTPSVGVILPHLEDDNFGWANPIAGIVYPHSSQGLLGVAPVGIDCNDEWGTPNWTLCDDLRTETAEVTQNWDVEITSEYIIREPNDAVSRLIIRNQGDLPTAQASVQGLVWNHDGRLCGATTNVLIPSLESGEEWQTWAHIWQVDEYAANPFATITNVKDLKATYSLQPRTIGANPGCPSVLPWND